MRNEGHSRASLSNPDDGDCAPAGELPVAGSDIPGAGTLPPAGEGSTASAEPIPETESNADIPASAAPAASDSDSTAGQEKSKEEQQPPVVPPRPDPPGIWKHKAWSLGLLILAIALAMISVITFVKYEDIDQNVQCDARSGRTTGQGSEPPTCTPDGFLDDKVERWIWFGVAIFSGVTALVALIWAANWGWNLLHPNVRPGELGIGAMILSSAALIIGLAALSTVVVYVLPITGAKYDQWRSYVAVVAGIMAAFLVAAVNMMLKRDPASASQSQSRVFDEIKQRWGMLDARINLLCDEQSNGSILESLGIEACIACEEAKVHRCRLAVALAMWEEATCNDVRTEQRPDPGAKWITGTGYMELWNRLHNAEEALLVVSSRQQAVSAALFDETRIDGSVIQNRDNLLDRIRRSVRVLGGAPYLSTDVNILLSHITEAQDNQPEGAQARLVLRDVRHSVNQFRDKSREALIRARNQLMWTGMLTGVAAFTIMILAVLAGAPPRTILAAAVFFLCGAVVGLFDQLRSSGEAVSPEEDFGLGRARLVYTPYISGLAAVGGVLITAMLYATVNGSALKYQPPTAVPTPTALAAAADETPETSNGVASPPVGATPAVETTPTATTPPPSAAQQATGDGGVQAARVELDPPPLALVFDLDENRFGLVIAAIFGLTPSLLISRLQGEANRYQADLQSTSGQERRR
jgi:hypothetical protein